VILVSDTLVLNSLVSEKYLETIKAFDGVVFHLAYHQSRLEETLGHRSTVLKDILNPPKKGLYRCRVVYSEDSCEVNYIKYTKKNIESLKLIYDDSLEYSKKFENREALNTLLEKKESCDEILLVKNGLITDTTIANIALFDGEVWLTPKRPLLHGTCRARLLDEGKIFAVDIKATELNRFKKIALMNAMIDFDIIATENIGEVIC